MAHKSGMDHMLNAAFHAKALKAIIKAALSGGWQAAAVQLLKHYWPQILAICLVLILLPVIIFCCLPAILFGFESSENADIQAMNQQAETVLEYYNNYQDYCKQREESIQKQLKDEGVAFEVEITGEPMEENWFVALYSVSMGNDLNQMNEQSIKAFVEQSIVYSLEERPAESDEASETGESQESAKILKIRYLSPSEFMEEYQYSDADQNWAQLMYTTLQNEGVPPSGGGGSMGSLFLDSDWRDHVSSGYGQRGSKFHRGIDIARPIGTQICAVKSGTVTVVDYGTTTYGYYVKIDHGDGMETLYAHCSKLLVTEGQKVEQGDVIALVGSTGRSTGPHCHFEVRLNGKATDPTAYLP